MVFSSGDCFPFTTRDRVTDEMFAREQRLFAVYRRRFRASSSRSGLNIRLFSSHRRLKFNCFGLSIMESFNLRKVSITNDEDALDEFPEISPHKWRG